MYAKFFALRPAEKGMASPTSREVPMSFSQWIRQIHRWLAIIFTLTVISVFIAIGVGDPPLWFYYLPLPPLFLMVATGLYMFALPYMAKRRKAQEKLQ